MEKLKKSVVAFRNLEDDDNTNNECNFLKRSAFNQYFAISQEMTTFEKEMFEKFMHEGTFVVNNVLKRNILKLRFKSLPDELREEMAKKEVPQTMSLSRVQKSNKKPKTPNRQSQNILGALTPRKSLSSKSKFNIFSTAIQWMTSRPVSDNPDLVLAEKLMKSSDAISNKSARSIAQKDFKILQAKCERNFSFVLIIFDYASIK